MSAHEFYDHRRLDCGVEFAALALEGRRTTSFGIRFLTGLVDEPDDRLGLARIVEETIGKGTEKRSAQELSDAFDAIGAQHGSGVGRESFMFRCSCLPEYADEALALHAELLCTPTYPDEYCRVAVDLGLQELTALEDDPQELTGRLIAPKAYGKRLGRHELGTPEGLQRIKRDDIMEFWRKNFASSRMQVSVAGAVDVESFARRINELFDGFGKGNGHQQRDYEVEFSPGVHHHHKELEQQHVLLCWPGVKVTDADYPVERVVLGILSGGMSSRLFTEVREKQGLVYWVSAWGEHPRNAGMAFMGASTTPARCDQTVKTLLREVERLAEDVTEEELERAKVGIIAKSQTHGDITRARLGELGSDLFHFGRPVPIAEKNERIAAVTIADIQRYLSEHPRDRLCIQTLGPRALGADGD
ncbi:MAG: insulinase family protein [Phycisphaerales bacterium]|nr:insulinase family protein [Phycisphaerales bacterium]